MRTELDWTHYRPLLKVDSDSARQWYMLEAATQNWSTRELERRPVVARLMCQHCLYSLG